MKVPEEYRLKHGYMGSDKTYGNNGVFLIPFEGRELQVIASDHAEWEHVSVSLTNRTPNWKEMCFIKNLFWDENECVVEFHPPKSEYVNNHEFCLHLWKKIGHNFEMPPSIFVGLKE
jgi:hypothetical protein